MKLYVDRVGKSSHGRALISGPQPTAMVQGAPHVRTDVPGSPVGASHFLQLSVGMPDVFNVHRQLGPGAELGIAGD
jgi:hypothetical protein